MAFSTYGKESCCKDQWLSPLDWYTGRDSKPQYYRLCFNCGVEFRYKKETLEKLMKYRRKDRDPKDCHISNQYDNLVYYGNAEVKA